MGSLIARALACIFFCGVFAGAFAGAPGGEPTAPESARHGPATRYTQTCAVCHEEGTRGAPIPGVVDDWSYRLDYGVEELYLNTVEGMGEMPPRGACADCSDEEIEAIVDFMLQQNTNDRP